MFSTEIIINSLLYALNQAVTSHIDVLGTINSAKDIYFQVKELCRSWGVTDTMLRNCWQFEEAVWEECEHKFEDAYFTFDSSIGKIQVVPDEDVEARMSANWKAVREYVDTNVREEYQAKVLEQLYDDDDFCNELARCEDPIEIEYLLDNKLF